MRVEHTDADPELVLGDLDWCLQVGVVGDDDRGLAVFPERVEQEMGSEVYVGALLLGAQDMRGLRPARRWFCQGESDRACLVLAVVDRDARD
jgi:hypothetical protein